MVKVFDKYLEDGRRSEPDFTKLNNAILEDVIAKEDFLESYLPNLDLLATKEHSVYIQDKTSRKVFEVSVSLVNNNDKVRCFDDKTDQCEHARYAIACSEFGRVVRQATKQQNNLNHRTTYY